jgi:hypothetical protein
MLIVAAAAELLGAIFGAIFLIGVPAAAIGFLARLLKRDGFYWANFSTVLICAVLVAGSFALQIVGVKDSSGRGHFLPALACIIAGFLIVKLTKFIFKS